MRNMLRYPLTAVEAANACEEASRAESAKELCGDTRPLSLQKAALFIMSRAAEFEAFARIRLDDEPPPVVPLFYATDGGRPLPFDGDTVGRMAREAEVMSLCEGNVHMPYTPVPFDQLTERDKDKYRAMGEAVARFTLIGDAARLSAMVWPPGQEKEEG